MWVCIAARAASPSPLASASTIGQMLVAHLVDPLGQAAEAEHRRALAQVGDRGRQHRIARRLGDGSMEIAIVPARHVPQPLGAQPRDALAGGIQELRATSCRRLAAPPRLRAADAPPARAGTPPSNRAAPPATRRAGAPASPRPPAAAPPRAPACATCRAGRDLPLGDEFARRDRCRAGSCRAPHRRRPSTVSRVARSRSRPAHPLCHWYTSCIPLKVNVLRANPG